MHESHYTVHFRCSENQNYSTLEMTMTMKLTPYCSNHAERSMTEGRQCNAIQ